VKSFSRLFSSDLRAALLLLIPFVVVLAWHMVNAGLPNDDPANLSLTALRISQTFQDRGLVAGLIAMLDLRGWRPILLPALSAPIFLATGNNVTQAIACTLLTLLAISLIYIYRLAHLCTGRTLPAALATSTVFTIPAVFVYSLVFYAEIAFLAATAGFLYHLLRSGFYSSLIHSAAAGLLAGFMIAMRPAESTVMLSVALAATLYAAVQRKHVDIRDAVLFLALFAIPTILLILSSWSPIITRRWIWFSQLFILLVTAALLRRGSGAPLAAHLALLSSGACLWWAGHMPALYEWVYTTTFGDMAQVTDRRSVGSVANTLAAAFRPYGYAEVAFFTALAIVAGPFLFKDRSTRLGDAVYIRRWAFSIAGTVLAIFVVLYAATGTGEPRRILPALVLLFVGVASVASVKSRVATIALFVWLSAHCLSLSAQILEQGVFSWTYFGHIPIPLRGIDGNWTAEAFLRQHVPPNTIVAVYTHGLVAPDKRVYEPAALELASQSRGSALTIGYSWRNSDHAKALEELVTHGYRYLLLDTYSHPVASSLHTPYAQFTQDLLQRIQSTDVRESGLFPVASFEAGGRRHILFELLSLAEARQRIKMPQAPIGMQAVASVSQADFPAANLVDRTPAAWGSTEGSSDVFAAVTLPQQKAVDRLYLRLFSPQGRSHLNQFRVVAADSWAGGSPQWRSIRARIAGSDRFGTVIAMPNLPDDTIAVIELDRRDPNWRAATVWGIGCLRSRGDRPNHLEAGTGVYVRELTIE
jgi:hypothetical protein